MQRLGELNNKVIVEQKTAPENKHVIWKDPVEGLFKEYKDGIWTKSDKIEIPLDGNITDIIELTQDEYNALTIKDKKTLYIVSANELIYPGMIAYEDEEQIKFCDQSDWANQGTPIGVVVVPSNHTPDGTVRIISIKGVTQDGLASDSNIGISWASSMEASSADTELPNMGKVPTWNNTIGGTINFSNSGYLPSDNGFSGATDCISGTLKYYNNNGPFIPSPYLADGNLNTDYNTISDSANALSDFNGISNTSLLVKLSGDYKAANACHMFGTNVLPAGNWYLPSCGELGYIVPRFNIINTALNTVGGVQLDNSGKSCWSSTEYNSYSACSVRAQEGGIRYDTKTDNYFCYVRPFASVLVPIRYILYKGETIIANS